MSIISKPTELIPTGQGLTDRWDREWLQYFLTEDPRPFLVSHQHLHVVNTVQGKPPSHVYDTRLARAERLGELPSLCIWINGDEIVGKNVLEIGCGPGLLGKQMGKIATSYVGIDYSQFALYMARLTSPSNCAYYHVSETARILEHAGMMDTMVGRFFFIHQNYQSLMWILELASVLLRPGGVISADFYLRNPAVPQGISYPAHHDLDERYPSCAFEYTMSDLEGAARVTGFAVSSVTDNLDLQRRFILFVKNAQVQQG